MHREGLRYWEADRKFGLPQRPAQTWERIYMEKSLEWLAIEQRGHKSTGRPRKFSKEVEEDLIAENQHLRAEVEIRWFIA